MPPQTKTDKLPRAKSPRYSRPSRSTSLFTAPPGRSLNKTKDSLLVIMPALNEEVYIESAINSWAPVVNDLPGSEILVIEGGSVDGTKDKLKKLTQKLKFLKVVDQKDKGHGNAIIQGYRIALNSDHSWVFQTDADGHSEPSDFYKLWGKKNSSHFVLGHRQKRKDPFFRITLSKLISLWIRILYGKKIKDPNIPFRLIKRDYLSKLLKSVPDGTFTPNIFLAILAAHDGQNLYNIPVTLNTGEKKSSISKPKLLKASLYGFKELVVFRQNFN